MSSANKKCAPGRDGIEGPTCLNRDELVILTRQYNKKFPNTPLSLTGSRTSLYNALRRRLAGSAKCNQDYCLLEHNAVAPVYNKVKHAFRPPKPKGWAMDPDAWLSNFEIDDAMKGYEGKFADFKYLGTFPVDCPMEYQCPLSGLSVRSLMRRGVQRIGVVFNLDYHYQGGSHWVAFYSDFRLGTVEYFDSYSGLPPKLIYKFMEKVGRQLSVATKRQITMVYNDRRHQYGHSECGMYSMFYIVSRLEGRSPADLTKKRILDSEMLRLRNYFFRNVSNKFSDD